MVMVTEFLLYVSFALLMGGLIIWIVPEGTRPRVIVPKKLLLCCTVLIPVLSFAPLLNVVYVLSEDMDYWVNFRSILFTFEIGKSWWFTVAISALLFILLYTFDLQKNSYLAKIGVVFVVFMVFAVGKAGHAASITQWFGFAVHSAHFVGVTIWSGVLMTVAWFSKDLQNWTSFLKWFAPLSVVCALIIITAGYFTMEIDLQSYEDFNASVWTQYKNSWMINYGQALLIKHLLYIPVLLFGLLNGFLLKVRQDANSLNFPMSLIRIESGFVLFMFGATAFMGQQTPPHQIAQTIQILGPSPLFDALYSSRIQPDMAVILNFQVMSFLLFLLSLLFLGLCVLSIWKKRQLLSLLFSILFLPTLYLGIMLGVN